MSGQHKYSFIQFFCCLGVGMMSQVANAAAPQSTPTITIDVNNPNGSVDYAEVDKFEKAQSGKQVKFASVENGELILSDKPIVKPKPQVRHMYAPVNLADLGWKIRTGYSIFNRNIVKVPAYRIANYELRKLPFIPEMPKMTYEPGLTALPASTWTVLINQSEVLQSPTAIVDASLWLLSAISILLIGGMFVRSRTRRFKETEIIYTGEIGAANEMIGKGELFDFRENAVQGKTTQVNTTLLNVLGNIGKFSQNGSIDTYFYMAYYIPSNKEYATVLHRKQKVKDEEKA